MQATKTDPIQMHFPPEAHVSSPIGPLPFGWTIPHPDLLAGYAEHVIRDVRRPARATDDLDEALSLRCASL